MGIFDIFKPKTYRLRKKLDRVRERLDLMKADSEKKSDIYMQLDDAESKLSQLEEGTIMPQERKYVENQVSDSLKRAEMEMAKLK